MQRSTSCNTTSKNVLCLICPLVLLPGRPHCLPCGFLLTAAGELCILGRREGEEGEREGEEGGGRGGRGERREGGEEGGREGGEEGGRERRRGRKEGGKGDCREKKENTPQPAVSAIKSPWGAIVNYLKHILHFAVFIHLHLQQ